jgi:antitoxin (DNA-binding transcriptional repressor) of toxin-antitoxin stability system
MGGGGAPSPSAEWGSSASGRAPASRCLVQWVGSCWRVEIFNIHEAKAQFSKIMRQIEQGQEVLIARGGVVIARIVPERAARGFRIGRDVGKAKIAADFDAPLPELDAYT